MRRRSKFPKIAGVAVREKATGNVYYGYKPMRHGPLLNRWAKDGIRPDGETIECGFFTRPGTFLTREEAYIVAQKSGQIRYAPQIPGKLFSEDVW